MRTMTDQPDRLAPAPRTRRRHVAAGSRVAALGLGTATMFGIVGALALAQQTTAADSPPDPAPAAPAPQIVVVVHRSDGSTVPASPTAAPAAPSGSPVAAPSGPVVLTAQPSVIPAPAAATPAASTHGSR